MHCTVIIPAAGRGERFGGDTPKQFLLLRGRPIIVHTVERFLAYPEVDRIIIGVSEEHLEASSALMSDEGWQRVELVIGGATRQETVSRGVAAALRHSCEMVAVHDAVRPFASRRLLREVLSKAAEVGAALPALTITDSIHRVVDDLIAETPDRRAWRTAQTPQCFKVHILTSVLEKAMQQGIEATDEAGAASRLGQKVAVVRGENRNVKITYPEDLAMAEAFFDLWSAE